MHLIILQDIQSNFKLLSFTRRELEECKISYLIFVIITVML